MLCAVACGGAGKLPGAIEPPIAEAPAVGDRATADPTVGAFEWSPDRKLAWSDFQGPPDLASDAAALTAYVVSYDTSCTGNRFTATVVTRFLPRVSWVKSRHLLDRQSAQTLQHEQTHFDLSEVQARRARRALQALPNACSLEDAELDRLFDQFGVADAEIQQQYDRETGNGTNAARQREWDARVEQWLRDLPR